MDEISKASASDAEMISSLVNSAYRGEHALKGWTSEASFLTGLRIDAKGVRALIDNASTTVFKYVRDHKIIGCVELRIEGKSAYFGMLSVEPTLQAGGVGKRLLAKCEEVAALHGCERIYMNVVSVRSELIEWYIRHGYHDTGIRVKFDKATPANAGSEYYFATFEKLLK